DNPAYTGAESATEKAFVAAIQADLMKRFPTVADAEKAGYFRYTDADETGAISYANLQWDSKDQQSPSQLWYDVKGKLIGADYSVLLTTSATPPKFWGILPARWAKFARPHVHWLLKNADGTLQYGLATSGKKWTAAGGSLTDPEANTVVKLGKAKDASQVAKVFIFPALWDLELWVVPNPKGAFAEHNPNVIPSKNAAKEDM
ncbi:MAG: hypothetical protein JOZ38_06990, partial [Candidatus Eremiobacteraeota bacterium]|nr:hypothetical protein [Candidatus Eremiobacteraeota bacterium]